MRAAVRAAGAEAAPSRLSPSLRWAARRAWQAMVLTVTALVLTSCGWRGLANVPVPIGPGTGGDIYTVYVQLPETLAINNNSKVMVADVYVGAVQKITLKDWVPVLTIGLENSVKLPKNATAKVGQTSLLGSQHVELDAPEDPSRELLSAGDVIPLARAGTYPSVEQTLASLAMILRGGGIPNLEVLQNELYNMIDGRAPQTRALIGKLDTFVSQLNAQRDDITHAIDSTNRLLTTVADQSDVVDRVLTELPPLVEHFADPQYLRNFVDAVDAMGRLGAVADKHVAPSKGKLHENLLRLQCPGKELVPSAPHLPNVLKFLLTIWPTDVVDKAIRGDYINVSAVIDTTYSSIDNAIFTGTGFSGALRALEQSFGRDPELMLPDVRYTTGPTDAPGGPYIERGDRNC